MKKNVCELFNELPCSILGDDVPVTGISLDSRTVDAGDLFFAMAGEHTDGANYINEALEKGVRALCVRKGILDTAPEDIVLIQTEDPRKLLGTVSDRFWDSPSKKLRLIGVTGTNGKTSVAYFLLHILSAAGIRAGLTGTVENRCGDRIYPQHLTTPEAHEFNSLLHLMAEQGAEYVVSEISSQGIDKGRVDGVCFFQALFTNLSGEHLDYHVTMEHYFQAKKKLFDSLPEHNLSIINADDPYGRRLLEEIKGSRGVSLKSDSYLHASVAKIDAYGSEISLTCGDSSGITTVARPGQFNCMNYLVAAASAVSSGIDFETVLKAAETLPPVPGRIQQVDTDTEYRVYVDYAHTDNALMNVLKALREFTTGRIITVFGAGGDRDRTKRPRMGKVAVDYSDAVIVTSDNPRTEDPQSIIEDILNGTKGDEYCVEPDRRSAIALALEYAAPGDSVLIAGKGHEDYQILGTEKIHFSDAETVIELLHNKTEQV